MKTDVELKEIAKQLPIPSPNAAVHEVEQAGSRAYEILSPLTLAEVARVIEFCQAGVSMNGQSA